MYIKRNISKRIVFSFAWKNLVIFLLYGSVITYAHHVLKHYDINIAIPFEPLSVIGIAVAFYVGFKNNQSYDRFWEARKIWGGIVNYSRTWGNHVMSFLTTDYVKEGVTETDVKAMQKRLIYRHIAWMNALRLQLRRPSSFSIDYEKRIHARGIGAVYQGRPGGQDWINDVGPFIASKEEIEYLKTCKNTATQLVRLQGEDLKGLMKNGMIENFRYMEMMRALEEFYNLQGKCERIKNTPLPRQYAYFSEVFIWIFIMLLPFGLIGLFAEMGHNFDWLTIPFYVVIAWIFSTMETVGDSSEDPFENFINDVPMTALCRTIEIDMREMLGETDIPEGIKPENGVLM